MSSYFRTTDGKGFHMTFANGVTVSVQFGAGNYCDNYSARIGAKGQAEHGEKGSTNAEVWGWSGGGEVPVPCLQTECDDPLGYQSADEVLARMAEAAGYRLVRAE